MHTLFNCPLSWLNRGNSQSFPLFLTAQSESNGHAHRDPNLSFSTQHWPFHSNLVPAKVDHDTLTTLLTFVKWQAHLSLSLTQVAWHQQISSSLHPTFFTLLCCLTLEAGHKCLSTKWQGPGALDHSSSEEIFNRSFTQARKMWECYCCWLGCNHAFLMKWVTFCGFYLQCWSCGECLHPLTLSNLVVTASSLCAWWDMRSKTVQHTWAPLLWCCTGSGQVCWCLHSSWSQCEKNTQVATPATHSPVWMVEPRVSNWTKTKNGLFVKTYFIQKVETSKTP